jgi:hypothetical protein
VLMTAAVPLQSPQKRRQTSATTPIVPPPAPICSPGGTLAVTSKVHAHLLRQDGVAAWGISQADQGWLPPQEGA